jgi:hypothetical protein
VPAVGNRTSYAADYPGYKLHNRPALKRAW